MLEPKFTRSEIAQCGLCIVGTVTVGVPFSYDFVAWPSCTPWYYAAAI